MRIYRIVLVLLLAVVLSREIQAGDKFNLSIAPVIYKTFGSTDYTMDIRTPIELLNGDTLYSHLKSELIFPLDAVMAGVQFTLAPSDESSLPLSFKAEVYTNINVPASFMQDSDWDRLPPFYDDMFSFTESDVEMKSGLVDVELRYRLITKPKFDLHLVGGLRYHHIHQDVINYKGWYKPFDLNIFEYAQQIPISGNKKGIIYKINYWLPKVGLAVTSDRMQKLSVNATAAYTYVSYDDYDDHLLRHKTAISDGTGYGVISQADIRYQLGNSPRQSKFFIEGMLGLVYLSASGDQTQRWYGPDGYYDQVTDEWVGAVAGDVYEGIPHDISSMQFSSGLKFGFSF